MIYLEFQHNVQCEINTIKFMKLPEIQTEPIMKLNEREKEIEATEKYKHLEKCSKIKMFILGIDDLWTVNLIIII